VSRRTRKRYPNLRTAEICGCLVVIDIDTRDVTVSSHSGKISVQARDAVTLWVYESLQEAGWPVEPLDVRDAIWGEVRP
jgi:hypothetical protein